MRILMMTTALVIPLALAPVHAQQTPPAGQPGDAAAQQQPDAAQQPAQQQPATGGQPDSTAQQSPAPTQPADPAAPPEQQPATGAAQPTAPEADPAPPADDPAAPDADPAPPADDPAAPDADPAAEAPPVDVPAAVVDRMEPNEVRGDWIIGTSVTSPQDETIGSIQDLIIDIETGQVTAAVLGVGGFLGIGAKNVAVDWSQLQIDYDGREITLDMTREQADAAPAYEFRERAEAPQPADTGAAPGAAPGSPTAPQQ